MGSENPSSAFVNMVFYRSKAFIGTILPLFPFPVTTTALDVKSISSKLNVNTSILLFTIRTNKEIQSSICRALLCSLN
jgi:hypothetical protein